MCIEQNDFGEKYVGQHLCADTQQVELLKSLKGLKKGHSNHVLLRNALHLVNRDTFCTQLMALN